MANEKHLLLTVQGDWTDSELIEETWQVGVRLALVMGAVDDVGTLPNNWDPAATSINRTETDWTITGNWLATSGTPTFHPDDYLNDQAAPAFSAWIAASGLISSKCRIRSMKLSPIDTLGHVIPAPPYSTGTPCLLTWTGAYPVGISGGELLPLQIACVASHRTAQTGRAGRGRMFLPGYTASALNGHAKTSTASATGAATAQADLLSALSVSGVGIDAPHVRPIVTGGNYTKYGVINTVRVGTVLDTQRRRRRSLTEVYENASPSY